MADNRGTVAPTIAQQTFTIASGVAGGLAGLVLAKNLAGSQEVSTGRVVAAALISATATFGAVLIIQPK
jgi:hypothetical protein